MVMSILGKVGTIPTMIELKYHYRLKIGMTVLYREEAECRYFVVGRKAKE